MQQRPPPPRWPPPGPPAPWVRPQARPAFMQSLRPPLRGFPGPPRFYPHLPRPPRGYFPCFVPARPPTVDAEQLWLDSFKRTHCSTENGTVGVVDRNDEPPLRLLRRRVAQAQKLVGQLKVAAEELIAIEKRLGEVNTNAEKHERAGENAALDVEIARLRVQRERKVAACEALKKELQEMDATSGLFPAQQLKEICAFAARVNKKKAYRKRVKLRRRAEKSIYRAVDLNQCDAAAPATESKVKPKTGNGDAGAQQLSAEEGTLSPRPPDVASTEQQVTTYLSAEEDKSPVLDPETLTFNALVAVRRAWDSYIVSPHTVGASTIPPHFVPPPSMPSAQWAVHATSSVRLRR